MASAEKQSRPRRSRLRNDWQGVRGARLRAAAPRYLAAGAVLLFVALGLRTVLWPVAAPVPPRPPASADAPSEDFALQFARAYLGYDASRPGLRARALAAFVPQGLESGVGFFAASGSQRVLWAEVASDQPALLGGRVIVVAAGISTQRAPLYLAVTVRHPAGRGLALLGYPAFVGAPSVDVASLPAAGEEVADRAVTEVAKRVIRNYLAGSAQNLRADLTSNASVTLPTLSLALQSVDQVAWIGRAGSGAVLVTVTASDRDGASYRLAYELGVAYRERPYVDFIEVVPTAS
jgi:Conjugative transposon protein TcpC